jgi:hypothetical protein
MREVDLGRSSLPRYHHQFLPDRVEIEPRLSRTPGAPHSRRKGIRLSESRAVRWGNMQAVFKARASGACAGGERSPRRVVLIACVQSGRARA